MSAVPPPLPARRVLAGQAIVKFALFATFAGMTSILLPTLVAHLDPAGKVASLAAITTAGFAVNAVAQPTVGALSDRTRTPFGRRLPWMAGGALLGGIALGFTGDARTLLALGALWVVVQLGLHGLEVAMDAYLVDAFPPSRRGAAAGVVGLALVAGTSAGALLAGALATRPAIATWALAGGVVAAVVGFALLVRDRTRHEARAPSRRSPAETLRAAATTVAAHPDFLKILLWRIGYGIAYGAVFAFLLYLVTDLIGVPVGEAPRLVGLITIVAGIASALSVVGGGWLSDRIGRRRPFLLVSSGVIVLGDLLLLLWPTVAAALVAAVLFGIGLGVSISCGRALASQLVPDQTGGAAAGLGLLSTAANIGQAAAPAVGAFAIGIGGYPAAFVVSIAGALLSSLAAGAVRSVR